ncbi:hypothetical protein CWC26_13480 [Pseudoalteromonas sp. S4488]|uniref:AIPR family protein n=1 Tax=unclassified Pseudoalteromonas TaxID=194690 RepID=UPI001022B3DE|nr:MULTISPECIES: AIPR family protein [unclassified Pseudoalteromonas]RZF78970.1 hypothetical protein EXT43_16310 [Pseudoalteromonas sp. CO109Y]TMO32230.1 hypothetical protein CWC27_19550 [Pseudoalteromonas sp. S4491]TMO37335.1 hypothetical protein CWC26_13480 [Pseudoalteromonas sp. S4488]
MATRHDYIILNKKLDKYFKLLSDHLGLELDISEVERRRLSFYIYILEQVCNESDIGKLASCVIDTNFNKLVFERAVDDCGVDAIYIDDEKLELKLFNFKYRNSFNPDKNQKLNDNFISTKFLNFAIKERSGALDKYPEDIKEKIRFVSSVLNRPNDDWKVELYQVSNEAKEVKQMNYELESLAEMYAIGINSLALPTISSFMTIRPENIDAQLLIDKEALMSYSEDNKASAKSFIARVKCSEILRITCNSHELRNELNIEDADSLHSVNLDFGVLFDNVRGLVKRSKYNKNIAKTLKNDPKKFFMYNNGITLIAENIISKTLAGKQWSKVKLNGLQVVNGGQTLRTIHEFNKESPENLEKYLYDAEVLVRMFMPDGEANEAHKIAEYTNSQNPIKAVDLKSLSTEQIEIERYLDECDIAYARKTGDTGPKDDKEYKHTINMETFAKLLKAKGGQPEKTTSSTRGLFEENYRKLFIEDFDLSEAPKLIDSYFQIIRCYKQSKLNGNQLKYAYIIYLKEFFQNEKFEKLIDDLETFLQNYIAENDDVTAVKALGSAQFKKQFMEHLGLTN